MYYVTVKDQAGNTVTSPYCGRNVTLTTVLTEKDKTRAKALDLGVTRMPS